MDNYLMAYRSAPTQPLLALCVATSLFGMACSNPKVRNRREMCAKVSFPRPTELPSQCVDLFCICAASGLSLCQTLLMFSVLFVFALDLFLWTVFVIVCGALLCAAGVGIFLLLR